VTHNAARIISNKEAEAIARLWDIGTMAVHQEAERMEATLGRDVAELYFRSELLACVPMSGREA